MQSINTMLLKKMSKFYGVMDIQAILDYFCS